MTYPKVKIQKVCAAFSLPTKVQATAITLFKRFLLGTSLLQHNLKVMMLTSIYVACKVEENYVSAEEFGKGMHEDASRVLNAELTLLSGLSFQLVTYSPYRSIEGFRHDIEEKLGCAGEGEGKLPLTRETLEDCTAAACKIAEKQLLTDAPLMHSPGKLALSALRSAARTLNVEAVLGYVEGVVKQSTEAGEAGSISQSLDAIDELVKVRLPFNFQSMFSHAITFVDSGWFQLHTNLLSHCVCVLFVFCHVQLGGNEPREEVVKDIDRKWKVWRTSNPASKGVDGDGKTDGRESKRHKNASKQEKQQAAQAAHDLEEAALDGP